MTLILQILIAGYLNKINTMYCKSCVIALLIACAFSCSRNEAEVIRLDREYQVSLHCENSDNDYYQTVIRDIAIDSNNCIYILDNYKCSIVRYYQSIPTTVYQGEGIGPGELLRPIAITVLSSGRIVVYDSMKGLLKQSTEMGWDVLTSTVPNQVLVPFGSRYDELYTQCNYYTNRSGTIYYNIDIVKCDKNAIAVDTLYHEEVLYDGSIDNIVNRIYGGIFFDVNDNGWSVICSDPKNKYYLVLYNNTGEIQCVIDYDIHRERRSALECAEDEEAMENHLRQIGIANYSDYEPNSYYPLIQGVQIDSMNRVWVNLGSKNVPTFNVHDDTGDIVAQIVLNNLSIPAGHARFDINGGILGIYDLDPEDYYVLHVYDIRNI